MPLAERTAAAVLADQAHRVAVDQQRTERQRLGHRPVDRVLLDHADPPLQLRQQPRMHGEASGNVTWVSATRLMTSSLTAVGVAEWSIGASVNTSGLMTEPGSIGFLAASRVSAKARSNCSW